MAAGPDQQRAGLSHQPRPERAPLEHQPGPVVQLARAMTDQVAEQPERDALRLDRSPAAARRTTFAPRAAYSSGIAQACASSARPTGIVTGLTSPSATAAMISGTVWATALSVHSRPLRDERAGR